jgi:hypothetical protein
VVRVVPGLGPGLGRRGGGHRSAGRRLHPAPDTHGPHPGDGGQVAPSAHRAGGHVVPLLRRCPGPGRPGRRAAPGSEGPGPPQPLHDLRRLDSGRGAAAHRRPAGRPQLGPLAVADAGGGPPPPRAAAVPHPQRLGGTGGGPGPGHRVVASEDPPRRTTGRGGRHRGASGGRSRARRLHRRPGPARQPRPPGHGRGRSGHDRRPPPHRGSGPARSSSTTRPTEPRRRCATG